MFSLNGKIALVTGAGSGIGAAIAESFVAAGATVFVSDVNAAAAEREADRLRALAKSRSESSQVVHALRLDVAQEEDCAAAARKVAQEHGRLDVLVNNAGIGHVGTTTPADLERLWRVNVLGVFQVTRAFLPGMIDRRRGNIINIASIGGIVAVRNRLAYTTTKFAVVGFTKAVALDHAAQGIRCNCICPCRVETPFVSAMIAQYPDPARARAEMEATQAIGRMARPDEVAAAALYLASDAANAVTGSSLILDGGWTAGK
jgi:2-keto-3-deoxy-L-fuconate dehydrogenase